jgi:hypothetical protein
VEQDQRAGAHLFDVPESPAKRTQDFGLLLSLHGMTFFLYDEHENLLAWDETTSLREMVRISDEPRRRSPKPWTGPNGRAAALDRDCRTLAGGARLEQHPAEQSAAFGGRKREKKLSAPGRTTGQEDADGFQPDPGRGAVSAAWRVVLDSRPFIGNHGRTCGMAAGR